MLKNYDYKMNAIINCAKNPNDNDSLDIKYLLLDLLFNH